MAWAGCGDTDESHDERSDAVAVSQAFVRAVAAADPEACDALTEDAADFVKVVSGERSCEAFQAQTTYVRSTFAGTPPAELPDELEAGQLQPTTTGAKFRFCTPDEVEVKLELEEREDGWLIDLVQASYVAEVPAGGGEEQRAPCDPASRDRGST